MLLNLFKSTLFRIGWGNSVHNIPTAGAREPEFAFPAPKLPLGTAVHLKPEHPGTVPSRSPEISGQPVYPHQLNAASVISSLKI